MRTVSEESQVLMVYVTANPNEAPALARSLVSEKLAACVNILPSIRSIYTWKGEIQDDEEALLIAKTTTAKFPLLRSHIKQNHTYETPEILGIPASELCPSYARWLIDAVHGEEQ